MAVSPFPDEPLDALIVGGGIVGAGVARDAAMRGLRVGLVEQHDFAFGTSSRSTRLLHGGLPPFFLSPAVPDADFQEWMDAYWAKDIQELFRLERRHSFLRFAELLWRQSGASSRPPPSRGPAK